MTRTGLAGLTVSALVHGVLVAGILLVAPVADRLPPLFIDLTQEDRPPGGEANKASSSALPRAAAPREPGGNRPIARVAPPAPAPAPGKATVHPDPPPMVPAMTPPPAPADVTPMREAQPTPDVPASPVEGRAPAQASDMTPMGSLGGEDAPAGTNAAGPGPETGDQIGGASSAESASLGSASPGAVGLADPGQALASTDEGIGEPGAAYAAYLRRLRQRVHEALRYPAAARRRSLTGTVVLELTVKPDGAIGPVTVVTSSAHGLLDQAAVDTVRSLRPQPFPADLSPRTLRVRLPVVFELQ
jgi:periplasmic protein TonB